MITFYAVSGQSLPDVCMNTYGSMDYYFKLLQDNGITDADSLPSTNFPFLWDNTLVVDAQNQRTIDLTDLKFATANSGNGNTFSIVSGAPSTPLIITGGGGTPAITSNMYQKTSATSYTATTEGETAITLLPLQTKSILQIERNIEPLLTTEYSWNSTTGVLTMVNPMSIGESLYILYTEMITT
jgi:hypothetical protein